MVGSRGVISFFEKVFGWGPEGRGWRGDLGRTCELHFLDDLAAVHVAGALAQLGEGRNILLDLLVFD